MKLFLQGEVLGSFETNFKDKETGKDVITKKVQMMEIRENGKVEVIEIKLNENQDITELVRGVKFTIQIKLFTPNNSNVIYYSQNGELKINK